MDWLRNIVKSKSRPITMPDPGPTLITTCIDLYGLIFMEKERTVPLPLKEVSVKARLVDFATQVTLEQTYKNEEDGPIEAVYMFPLDEAASVVQFEAELDGRTIHGMVMENEMAEKQYQQAIQHRQTAFLAQENKPDIFKVKVGNLSPGSEAKIKLTYLTEVSVEGQALRFFLPTTIAPRYIPESDSSQEAKEIAEIPYSMSSPAPMMISVECEMKSKIISIESPTHTVTTHIDNSGRHYFLGNATLAGHTTDMDRDFVLLVTTENPHLPRVCIEKSEKSVAAFVSLVPSFNLDEQPAELIFLLDRSGSMMGQRIRQAKAALTMFLLSLPMDCYFNIVGFGNFHKFLFRKSRKYDNDSLGEALAHARALDADMGGTEIYQPLEAIFKQKPIKGYHRKLFVLTDGEVSNTKAVIKLVKDHSQSTQVFSLGIGESVSHHLVGGIARAGGGTAEYATYKEALEPKVQRQLKNGLFPALSEVTISWEGIPGEEMQPKTEIVSEKTLLGYRKPAEQEHTAGDAFKGPRQAPYHVPPVFNETRILVYCIWEDGSVPTGVTIKAMSPDGELAATVNVGQDDILQGNIVHRLAARKLIRDLEEGSSWLHFVVPEPTTEKVKEEVVKLGVKYGLVSSLTSFVAVDPRKHESDHSVWPLQTCQVANQIPYGWHGVNNLRSYSLGQSFSRSASKKHILLKKNVPANASYVTVDSLESPPLASECITIGPRQVQQQPQLPGKLEQLMSLINFDGSFCVDPQFAQVVGISWQEITDAGNKTGIDLSTWVTAVAIKYMETVLSSRKETWELAAAKSKKWLSKSTPNSDSILNQAEAFLKDRVAKK